MNLSYNAKKSPIRSQSQHSRLKKRVEFLAVAKGVSKTRRAFKIQAIKRNPDLYPQVDPSSIRIGFTVTKKTGNSPERNRIKRRLRAAWQTVAPIFAQSGFDYVLIGRRQVLEINFEELKSDLISAVNQLGKLYEESHPKLKQNPPTSIKPNNQ